MSTATLEVIIDDLTTEPNWIEVIFAEDATPSFDVMQFLTSPAFDLVFSGPPGVPGDTGVPGVGVADVTQSVDHHLLVELTDTTVIDAGALPPGPQGPPGPASGAVSYVFSQDVPATVWTVNHNLGGFPLVSVVDSAGTQGYGDVNYVDANTFTITFTAAFSGKAYYL